MRDDGNKINDFNIKWMLSGKINVQQSTLSSVSLSFENAKIFLTVSDFHLACRNLF